MRKMIMAILLMAGVSAHGGVIISDIELEVRASNYTYQGAGPQAAINAFNAGAEYCSMSLTQIVHVGAGPNCGIFTNHGQSISFDLNTDQNVRFQFGTDWGRGGLVYDSHGNWMDVLGDTWWARNFNHGDVFSYDAGPIQTRLTFLGFEGCCGGSTSARYSTDGGSTWQNVVAAAPVPEPSMWLLLVIGVGALWLRRNLRQARRG